MKAAAAFHVCVIALPVEELGGLIDSQGSPARNFGTCATTIPMGCRFPTTASTKAAASGSAVAHARRASTRRWLRSSASLNSAGLGEPKRGLGLSRACRISHAADAVLLIGRRGRRLLPHSTLMALSRRCSTRRARGAPRLDEKREKGLQQEMPKGWVWSGDVGKGRFGAIRSSANRKDRVGLFADVGNVGFQASSTTIAPGIGVIALGKSLMPAEPRGPCLFPDSF